MRSASPAPSSFTSAPAGSCVQSRVAPCLGTGAGMRTCTRGGQVGPRLKRLAGRFQGTAWTLRALWCSSRPRAHAVQVSPPVGVATWQVLCRYSRATQSSSWAVLMSKLRPWASAAIQLGPVTAVSAARLRPCAASTCSTRGSYQSRWPCHALAFERDAGGRRFGLLLSQTKQKSRPKA